MSRLENTRNKKNSKKKYKTVCRRIFIFMMIFITLSSIFLIDYRINKILEGDSKNNLIKYLEIFKD